MSTIKSSAEHLTVTSDGTNKHTYIQDNGATKVATTTTGIDVTGDYVNSGGLYSDSNSSLKIISGGNASNAGSNLTLYGGTNASAGTFRFRNGTSVVAEIDSAGRVTMPNQPAFSARMLAQQSNIATGYNVVTFNSEIFDQGSNFNTATYQFTAPVTGKYMLTASVASTNLPLNAQWFFVQIDTSNRNYTHSTSTDQFDATADAGHPTSYTLSVLADMDAGDTASVRVYQYTGTVQTDIEDNYSHFSGYLVA